MPKNKKEESDDSDSGPDDRAPAKKQKTTKAGGSGGGDSDTICELGRNRQVRMSEFKGRRYLDIREFYLDKGSDEYKPGKKGITLMLDEFNKLVENADAVRKAFAKG